MTPRTIHLMYILTQNIEVRKIISFVGHEFTLSCQWANKNV